MIPKKYSFTKAINEALHSSMKENEKSVCIGLGINDPKRIFGTTENLVEVFGEERVIEPPTSENALTGIAFGLSLNEYSVCLMHQRFDFSLLSFDQIINTLAKWNFMFNQNNKTSILIRMIIGRGWGQGPTHSQSYHSFLASIPGLNVYYPTNPLNAYLTIKKGLQSRGPTIMIEHRWLHNSSQLIENFDQELDILDSLKVYKKGSDITLLTYGYMLPEALKADKFINEIGIKSEIISLERLTDITWFPLYESIKKTRNLLIIEPYYLEGSIWTGLIAEITRKLLSDSSFLNGFDIVSLPFENESTSYFQTKKRYINYMDIILLVCKIMKINKPITKIPNDHHDVPGKWFTGPF